MLPMFSSASPISKQGFEGRLEFKEDQDSKTKVGLAKSGGGRWQEGDG